jgi:hypothetical protein
MNSKVIFLISSFVAACAVFAQDATVKPPEPKEWVNVSPSTLLGGRMVSAGYLKGKVVIVDCRDYGSDSSAAVAKALQNVWNTYRGKAFMVLGSHRGSSSSQKVKEFMKKNAITYPVCKNAMLSNGEPEGMIDYIYVMDTTLTRRLYAGADPQKAAGVAASAIAAYVAPVGKRHTKKIVEFECENLPGHAYLRLKEMQKEDPVRADAFAEKFAAISKIEKIEEVAKLVQLSLFVKDRDSTSKSSSRITAPVLDAAVEKFSGLKNHASVAVVQEVKNALADLKWAAAAIKARDKRNQDSKK